MNICTLAIFAATIESHFGYDWEDRQPCKCETSQKSPDVLFDSVLIVCFTRNQQMPDCWIRHLGCPCYLSLVRGSRRGQWVRGPPLENSQKYRVCYCYWSRSPEKSKKLPASMLGHHHQTGEAPFKWCFADGPMMAR